MNLSRWPNTLTVAKPHHDARAIWIAWWALQPHAETGLGAFVVEKLRCCRVLADDQVHSPICIVVGQRRSALFTVHKHAAFLRRNRFKVAFAVAFEPQTTPAVVARGRVLDGK